MPYLLPVIERYALLGEALWKADLKISYWTVERYDDYGIIVYLDSNRRVIKEDLLSVSHGEQPSMRLVVADSPWDAISVFAKEVPGASGARYPAVTIDPSRPILELPECLNLQEDAEGFWYCVPLDADEDEDDIDLCPLGMHELPEPDDCPIFPFLENPRLLVEMGIGRERRIGRYNFITTTHVVERRS